MDLALNWDPFFQQENDKVKHAEFLETEQILMNKNKITMRKAMEEINVRSQVTSEQQFFMI